MRVNVRVQPGASRDQVALAEDGSLEVRLRARPIEGKANEALVALLAEALGVRKWEVVLVRGQRARLKVVELPLASVQEIEARLGGSAR